MKEQTASHKSLFVSIMMVILFPAYALSQDDRLPATGYRLPATGNWRLET